MNTSKGILGRLGRMFDGSLESSLALQSIGTTLMQLDQGRAGNNPALTQLMQRRARSEQKRQLQPLLDRFGPERAAILAQMEPQAAISVIYNEMFAKPDPVNYQTVKGPNGGVFRFDPRSGTTSPLIEGVAATPDPVELATMLDPTNSEQLAEFGIDPSTAGTEPFEVKYRQFPDGRREVYDFSIPGGRKPGDSLLPGQEAVDKAYADTYIEWMKGGGADKANQAAQIGSVLDQLEAGEELTGPKVGMIPDFARAVFAPEAKDAQERVEQVVQRSLREVLGAQFAEKEGERLIARAYNPALPPEYNIRRLRALFAQLEAAHAAQDAMATYFGEKGTLWGYQGPGMPTVSDFEEAIDAIAVPPNAAHDGGDAIDADEMRWLEETK